MTFSAKDTLPPEQRRAIERAERRDGFQYGALMHGSRPVFVQVHFYPTRRWTATYLDVPNETVRLTRKLASELQPLKL